MNAKFIFYGIGRGLKKTLPSIEKKLIKTSLKYFTNTSVLHLVQTENNISNERSGDFGEVSKITGCTFHNKKPIFINYEPKKNTPDLFSLIKNSKCLHGDNHKSSINLLKQLNLLNSNLIKTENDEVVIFCRDDIYIDSFDKNIYEYSKKLKHDEFIVSAYDWQNGISDRFLISKGKAASLIKNRIRYLNELINIEKGINGERLMRLVTKKHNLKPIAFNIKFTRVRLDETFVNERRFLPPHRPFEIIRIFIAYIRNFFIKLR